MKCFKAGDKFRTDKQITALNCITPLNHPCIVFHIVFRYKSDRNILRKNT